MASFHSFLAEHANASEPAGKLGGMEDQEVVFGWLNVLKGNGEVTVLVTSALEVLQIGGQVDKVDERARLKFWSVALRLWIPQKLRCSAFPFC